MSIAIPGRTAFRPPIEPYPSWPLPALLVPCLLALATGGPVRAEEATAAALGPITVTATKTARDPFEVPESVSVIDRRTIERMQPQDLDGLLKDLPNVAVGGGPRGVGQTVTIRGISDDRILFLIDGARQDFVRGHNARIFIEPDLLRQVDVLRGPASALWGSGAIGGVIAMETANAADLLRPGETSGGRVRGGYQGVNGQWMGGAGIYGLVGERFDYLLDLTYRDAGDYKQGDGDYLENSGYERLSGLAKASWTPDGINRFTLSYLGLDEQGEVPSNPQIQGTPDELVDQTTDQQNLALRYTANDPDNRLLQPSVLLYRNRTDIDQERLIDGRQDSTRFTTNGLDARNTMRFGGAGSLVQVVTFGVDYYEDESESERDGAPRPSYPDGSQEVFGVYLQDEILIGSRWTIVPGLRWDSYKSEADSQDSPENEDSAFSAKLGLDVLATDWLSLQASYNEAFRAPSVSEVYLSGVHFTCGRGCQNLFVPNPDLAPEKAHNTELGFRLRKENLLTDGDEGRFQARVFRNDVTDFIDLNVIVAMQPVPGNPGRGGVTISDNVRDARLQGYELEASYRAPRWFAGLAYSQTRGEDEETDEPLSSVQPDEWIAKTGLTFPVQGLDLGLAARFVAAQNEVPPGGTPSQSYQVLDLWLGWRPTLAVISGLRLDFGIDNLLDEEYQPYLSALPAPGRNIKATLAWQF